MRSGKNANNREAESGTVQMNREATRRPSQPPVLNFAHGHFIDIRLQSGFQKFRQCNGMGMNE
jgi:hypothetical protein